MENSLKAYSSAIALRTLLIKALMFRTNLKEFFDWSGGWKTPIYTDQRLHLGYPESVELILNVLKFKVDNLVIKPEGILGTKVSGIPWAVLLADALKVPVIVIIGTKAFTFDYPKEIPTDENYDLIASSSPFGIPLGIRTAYVRKKGFIYVRNSKKQHGIGSKVVGAFTAGQSVCYFNQEAYGEMPALDMMSLVESGLCVIHGNDENYTTRQIDISRMNILGIEDTISSGKSSLTQIHEARALGAEISDLISLFSYEFFSAEQLLKNANIKSHDLYSYSDLMNNAREQGYINQSDFEIVRDWYHNPIAWSNKYGETNFEW